MKHVIVLALSVVVAAAPAAAQRSSSAALTAADRDAIEQLSAPYALALGSYSAEACPELFAKTARGWRFQSRTFVPSAAGDARVQLR
jgi:hypothetical protein